MYNKIAQLILINKADNNWTNGSEKNFFKSQTEQEREKLVPDNSCTAPTFGLSSVRKGGERETITFEPLNLHTFIV